MGSPSDEVELDENGKRLFTVTMLEVYREAALANYAEAEELLSRALDLREAGHAMLDRASQLAFSHALDVDSPKPVDTEDDVDW